MWYIVILDFSAAALARCGFCGPGGKNSFSVLFRIPIQEDNDFGNTKRSLRFRLDCGQTCENVKKTYGNNFDPFWAAF
jgi:hypothetical protein